MMKSVYGAGNLAEEVGIPDVDFMVTENNSESEPEENRDNDPSATQPVDDLDTVPAAGADREDDAADVYNKPVVFSDMELEESKGTAADLPDTELPKNADLFEPDKAPIGSELMEKMPSSPSAELSEVEGFGSELALGTVQQEEEMASSPAGVLDDVAAELIADDTPSDTDIAQMMDALPGRGTSGHDLDKQDELYADLPEEMVCSPVVCLPNEDVEELGGDPAGMMSDSETFAVISPGKLEDQSEPQVRTW